jgi:hypothetical protein
LSAAGCGGGGNLLHDKVVACKKRQNRRARKTLDKFPSLGMWETDIEIVQKRDGDTRLDKKWWWACGDVLGGNPQHSSLFEFLLANGPEIDTLQVSVKRVCGNCRATDRERSGC